jgi:hypothetical protein
MYEREPLIAGLSFALVKAARTDRSLHDRDLLAALHLLAQRYRTLVESGLHYAEPVTSLPQQGIITALEKMLSEYRELEQKHVGRSTLKDSELLQILVFMLRTGHSKTSGRPRSRAFADFLIEQFPESAIAGPQVSSSLIVP